MNIGKHVSHLDLQKTFLVPEAKLNSKSSINVVLIFVIMLI